MTRCRINLEGCSYRQRLAAAAETIGAQSGSVWPKVSICERDWIRDVHHAMTGTVPLLVTSAAAKYAATRASSSRVPGAYDTVDEES